MSQSNAAARKRRAGGTSMPWANEPVVQPQTPAGGLTLPQVIALVDRRLVVLETFMKDSRGLSAQQAEVQSSQFNDEVIDEINNRFELLAGEVAEMKDILIKLQSFTMEVNKRLVDERIHILSDVKETVSTTISVDNNNTKNIVLELSDE